MKMINLCTILFALLVGSSFADTEKNETAVLMNEIMTQSAKMWIPKNSYGSKIDLHYQDKYEEDSDEKYDEFVEIDEDDEKEIYKDKSIAALNNLFESYNADKDMNDCEEVDEFVNAIWDTDPMKVLKKYLVDNKTIFENEAEFKTNFTEIWFRGFFNETHGKNSSGFQHVFMGEIEGDAAHGFHNWVRYYNEEKNKRLTYKGWTEKIVMGEEVDLVSLSFEWNKATKPVSTIAFGTKPEYEMAVLTLCWYMMPGEQCPIIMLDRVSMVMTESYDQYVHTAYFTVVAGSSAGLRPDLLVSMVLSLFLSLKYYLL